MAGDEQARGRSRIAVIVGAVVVVAAIVVGVLVWTDGADDPAGAVPTTERPAPTLSPLRLGDKPLWTGPRDIQEIESRDDLLLYYHGNSDLTLAEAATGKARWTFEKLHDLGGIEVERTLHGGPGLRHVLKQGDTLGVLIEYYHYADCRRDLCNPSPQDHSGLAMVSATDGSVVWRSEIMPSYPANVPYESRPNQVLRVADDRVAVVSITTGPPNSQGHLTGHQRTFAIDVQTGAKLWEKADGVWPQWIVGNTILGVDSTTSPGSGLGAPPAESTVVATDLMTGEKRWDLAGSRLVEVAGDLALARSPSNLLLLTADTGQELGTVDGADRLENCATDDRTLIACALKVTEAGPHRKVVTFEVQGRRVGSATPGEATVGSVDAVWDGRIFVHAPRVDTQTDPRQYTLDSAGNEIDTKLDLPGRLRPLTADRAAFLVGDGSDAVLSVYEVRH